MAKYPSWAAQVVWYQIFPDRFCKANTSNPISSSDIAGTTPWNIGPDKPWQIHPWTSDWYARQPYEEGNSKNLKTNILRRRYCGDINGIISKLDYLSELGVSALYITPLQYSPSLHKYDGTNFLHVDPFLGSNPIQDKYDIDNEDFGNFDTPIWTTADKEALELIRQAHSRGIKIVFDGVFNHIGYNSKPFQDVLKNRQKSKYADWFLVDFKKSTKKKLSYEKFWGCVDEMPKLNYSCKEVKRYVFASLKRWLKPVVDGVEYEGIDGWRIDHAIGVPPTFWKSVYEYVKTINEDALFIGELIEPLNIVKPYLDNVCFDSVMNYGFYFSQCQFFAAENNYISAVKFDNEIRNQLQLLKLESNFLMMNLLGTHDSDRMSSYIVNRQLKEFGGMAEFWSNSRIEDKKYTSRKPNLLERKIQKMMVAFEFSMVGSPMVFYGDELGMWGANDPDCRKPMMWPDMKFDDEQILVGGRRTRKFDKVEVDYDILDFYKKIIKLRNTLKVLWWGRFETYFADPEKRVYVFGREDIHDRIIFAFNREQDARELTFSVGAGNSFVDYFDGSKLISDATGMLRVNLQPVSFAILVQQH